MYIDYTPEQRALQQELRDYLERLMTPALRDELRRTEGGGPEYSRALQQLAADRWLGLGWPEAHGGRGRPAIEEFIFFDEVQRAGFPIPLLTLNTVGPTLVHFGSDAQRAEYLPRILAGRCHFSIGYTEPGAGTDLAGLQTRAVRDGDAYVVNGQKIWNSLGSFADYIWLAARTDPDAPKHEGISILIVPTDAPGVSMTPMQALGGNEVSAVYLEDVRVPAGNLVGGENRGWKLITTQLNHERIALMSVGPLARLTSETRALAAASGILEAPWASLSLARVEAKLEVLRLMNWKLAWDIERGAVDYADASAIKVYGSELYVEAYRLLLEVLGPAGALRQGSAGAALRGEVERYYRATLVLTFGGGTNEVQRDIIAMAGLRLPRSRR
jgi:alkylation response protein AidB-like acyl-CoA dehydrogenase